MDDPRDTLTQLQEVVDDINRQGERIALRDSLILTALAEDASVPALAKITGLTRSWIYQIRGPRKGSISE